MLSGLIDSAHSYPAFTKPKFHNWYTRGAFLLVLSYKEEILSML